MADENDRDGPLDAPRDAPSGPDEIAEHLARVAMDELLCDLFDVDEVSEARDYAHDALERIGAGAGILIAVNDSGGARLLGFLGGDPETERLDPAGEHTMMLVRVIDSILANLSAPGAVGPMEGDGEGNSGPEIMH